MTQYISVQRISVILAILFLMSSCTSIRPNYDGLGTDFSVERSDFTYNDYALLLKKHVDNNGLVDYKNLVQDPDMLNNFYALIGTYSPDSHPSIFPATNDKLAYWINAYNATVMKGVIEYYPISSVEDVKTPALLFSFPVKAGSSIFSASSMADRKPVSIILKTQ